MDERDPELDELRARVSDLEKNQRFTLPQVVSAFGTASVFYWWAGDTLLSVGEYTEIAAHHLKMYYHGIRGNESVIDVVNRTLTVSTELVGALPGNGGSTMDPETTWTGAGLVGVFTAGAARIGSESIRFGKKAWNTGVHLYDFIRSYREKKRKKDNT